MLSDEERELLQWETDGGRHLDEPPRWRNGDMPPGKPAPPEQPPPPLAPGPLVRARTETTTQPVAPFNHPQGL